MYIRTCIHTYNHDGDSDRSLSKIFRILCRLVDNRGRWFSPYGDAKMNVGPNLREIFNYDY